jgi:5-methylcytosine-specific restriction endonuclease McrBC GTP-binding regulatory subunit McrB
MSYEDFVEGIKPQEPTAEQMQVAYKVEPGIFKLICEKARQIKELKTQNASIFKSVRFYKMSLGGFNRSDIYEWCLENNCLALGWGNDVNFESYKGISDWATYRDKFITENPALVKESRFNITAMYGFQNMRAGDIVAISKGNRIIDAIGRVEGEYYWGDNSPFGYFQFRKIEWLAKNINQDPEYFFNKKITQQSIYQFYDEDVKKESFVQFFTQNSDESTPKPYILIIDEINRGNVSQIFGELITLLETDKRMGNDEALEVTLPYSKDLFSVPSNLYIIGTMNTADRSVEALDSALRRRFSFVEMPPKTDLPELQREIAGIKLSELLETINRRIEKLLDKDHLIGHSYFLNISNLGDLQNTFYRNIIPLLQEYFFGDFGKIGLVLGSGFVEVDNKKSDFADFRDYEDFAELDDRRIYRIKKEIELAEEGFKSALGLLLNKQI